MTDLEVLRMVINDLENINVPVKYKQQISDPIANSAMVLKQLHNAIFESARQQAEQQKESAPDENPEDGAVPGEAPDEVPAADSEPEVPQEEPNEKPEE